jgi:hypothetical protein
VDPINFVTVLGPELEKVDARKLQSAVFLAQSYLPRPLYNFSLSRGRVHSEQLDSDLVFLVVVFSRGKAASVTTHDPSDDEARQTLRESLSWLLQEENQVLEAAATTRFFEREGLGDPSSRLTWFGSLPEPIRRRAAQVEEKVPAAV